tara:strand:+ start:356 stop:523 length:168 start_codon:yes stop_codon:yes gene_type:complete
MAKIVHQIAHCTECGEQWGDYKNSNAQKQAYAHAKKTGHKVSGETGTAWSYHFPK